MTDFAVVLVIAAAVAILSILYRLPNHTGIVIARGLLADLLELVPWLTG